METSAAIFIGSFFSLVLLIQIIPTHMNISIIAAIELIIIALLKSSTGGKVSAFPKKVGNRNTSDVISKYVATGYIQSHTVYNIFFKIHLTIRIELITNTIAYYT